jgi:hypothetical protein
MEILQNSILKLVIRQGSDSDRRSIILDSGELGYTVDTYRVFVGDGFLSGGNVVGNLFRGSAPTITNVNLWPSIVGDSAFASDTQKLYALQTGNGQNIGDWLLIGGVYSSNDPHLSLSNDNKLTLNPLSANTIALDAVTSPITIDSGRIKLNPLSANHISSDAVSGQLIVNGGKITLAPLSANTIALDAVTSPITIDSGRIKLNPLSANHISSDAVVGPIILSTGRIALSSKIPFQTVSTTTITFQDGFNVTSNGSPSNGIAINSLSSNIIINSNQIYGMFYGLSGGTMEESRNISTFEILSAGHYKFTFGSVLPTQYYIPMVQIFGIDALAFTPRVISTTLSSFDVKILNDAGASTNANIYFLINY